MGGAKGNQTVPLRSLVCTRDANTDRGVQIRGRGEGDAEVSYFKDQWTTVDGVLTSLDDERIYEELGAHMCEDVRKGQNTCCFTYGESNCGQAELVLALIQTNTKELLKSVEAINSQTGAAASLQISLFELNLSEEVKDLLDPSGAEIGSYSVWQDPLRGPVVPYVRSLHLTTVADFDAHLPRTFFEQLLRDVDLTATHIVYQATLYSAQSRKATPTPGVSHQVSSMRLFLLSQSPSVGNEIFSQLLEIVDGLAGPQDPADEAKIRHLRSLVRERALTYLMSESLGGNCATTAVGCLGGNGQSATNILEFAAKARRIRGSVGQNSSDHITVVGEIRKQIREAEDRVRTLGRDSIHDSLATDWESNITIKRVAIELLEDLAAQVEGVKRPLSPERGARLSQPVPPPPTSRRPAGGAKDKQAPVPGSPLPHARDLSAAPLSPLTDATASPDRVCTNGNAVSPLQKDGEGVAPKLTSALKGGSTAASEQSGSPGRGGRSGAGRSAEDARDARVRLTLENKRLRDRMAEVEAELAREVKARGEAERRLDEAEEKVKGLESEICTAREREKSDLERMLEGTQGHVTRLEKQVRLMEEERDVTEAMHREVCQRHEREREDLRTDFELRKRDMQALLQQKKHDLEVENAAMHEERREMHRMLCEGKRQYAILLKQLRQRQNWRPPGRAAEVPTTVQQPKRSRAATHTNNTTANDRLALSASLPLSETLPQGYVNGTDRDIHSSSVPQSPRDPPSRDDLDTPRNGAPSTSSDGGKATGRVVRQRRYSNWYNSKVVARQRLTSEKLRAKRDESTPTFRPMTNRRPRCTGTGDADVGGVPPPQHTTELTPHCLVYGSGVAGITSPGGPPMTPPPPPSGSRAVRHEQLCAKLTLEPAGSPSPPPPQPATDPRAAATPGGGASRWREELEAFERSLDVF